MRAQPALLTMDDSIKSAIDIMVNNNIDAVPIIDESGDVYKRQTKTLALREILVGTDLAQPVSKIMIHPVKSINPDEDVAKLITINVGNLPVVENQRVLGLVTLSDTIRAYFSSLIALHAELNAVIDSAHNGILTVNEEGQIVLINRAAELVLNLKREDVVGQKVKTILPQSQLPETLASGQSSFGQKVVYRNKGFISNITPVLGNGQVIGAVAVFQDISELELISEELSYTKEMKEELIAIIDSSFDGIHVTDNDGKTLRANRSFGRITGTRVEDLIGKTMQELVTEGVYSQDISTMVLIRRESVTISQKSKPGNTVMLSLIHISEPTRRTPISYAVF